MSFSEPNGYSTFTGVFKTAAEGNPDSQEVTITANNTGPETITIVGNDVDTVATLATALDATATGAGASEILASGDANKIEVKGGWSNLIKQTGYDSSLAGLAGNSGVTITTDQGLVYYDFGINRLVVYGGLKMDPEEEVAIFQHDQNANGKGTVFSISGAAITGWKYGMSHTYNSDGNIVVTFTSDTNYELGQSLYFQGVGGDSVDSFRRFNNLPHIIKEISSDTRTITLDYKDCGDTLVFDGGSRARTYPGFEYGSARTNYGKTRTSRGTGIFITGQSNNNWHPDGYGMSGGSRTKFLANGGAIVSTRPWSFSSHVEWEDLKFINTRNNWTPEARGMSTGYVTNVELVNTAIGNFNSLYTKEFKLTNASFFRTYGTFYELPLFNVDTSENTFGYDYGEGSGKDHSHTLVKVYNHSAGSSFRSMWRNTTGSSAQAGVTEIYRNVSLNIKDIDDNPLQDVKVHVRDYPSQYARHSALRNTSGAASSFSVSISATTPAVVTHGSHGLSTGDCVAIFDFPDASGTGGADVVNGRKKITVIDADTYSLQNLDGSDVVGTINHTSGGKLATATEYNYLDVNEYLNTSDANGTISEFSILIATQLKDYNTNEPAALQTYGGPYAIDTLAGGSWRDTSVNRGVKYEDWDTDRFGGFYKVDRRGVGNTVDDIFSFNFCAYDKLLGTSNRSLLGTQTLTFDWILFDDPVITVTDKTVVDGYTQIINPEQFYDRAKSFLTSNFAGETETIVTRSGNTIDIGTYDLDVDSDENAPVFAFDGSKITIKADTFVGNILTTGGTITLLNDAKIVGTYGDISVLPFTISNVEAGSTIQLYNVTNDNEIINDVVTGTSGTKVTFTGTYANALAEPDDEVRLRITCQSGATALLPYESFGVATTAGINFKANQLDDTIYNANAIDGSAANYDSTSLEIDADFTNFEIDVSDTDNPGTVTVQQIYAKYAYLVTTSEGIDKFFGAITAVNPTNFRINTSLVDLKIQNISSSDMIITGARLYRDDNTTIIRTGYLNNDQAQGQAGSLSHDTGEFLQYIQPQVEAATQSIKRNTNLIPGLF